MDFRDRKKAILRAKSRPLWQAGSRVGSPTTIVNKVVGSQPKV